MSFFLKLIFFFSLCSSLGAAEKYLYFFGGGGEPKGETTIFDNGLKEIGSFVRKSKWKTTLSFDGGHTKTEAIAAKEFKGANNIGGFTEASMKAALDDLLEKIENGTLKKNDQLLLIIDTHGAKKAEKEKTHKIAFASGEPESISLDRLESVVSLAKEKGIKLAIIDLSCYSGNTLNIENESACVISASGANHKAYSQSFDLGFFIFSLSFSTKFLGSMKEGKNLEEIYLLARQRGFHPDFPMISTPEGKNIQELLYNLITPYLYYNSVNSFFNPSFLELSQMYYSKNLKEMMCSLEIQNEQLNSILDQVEEMEKIPDELLDISLLRKELNNYRSYQRTYEASLMRVEEAREEINNILTRDYSSQENYWKGIDGISLLNADYEEVYNNFQKFHDEAPDADGKKYWKGVLELINAKQKISDEVRLKLSVSSKNKVQTHFEIVDKANVTYALASKVSTEAKKVYNRLYRDLMSKSKTSNACRDFVL